MTPAVATSPARRLRAGFTLLEVMIGLALLGLALVVLVKSAANSIFNAQQAHMIGIATDLARGKMYELEEKLLKDGFTDLEQHEEDQPFSEEGWQEIKFSYKIEVVELPGWEQLQKLAQDGGCGGSAGSAGSGGSGGSGELGAGGGNCFGDSALGGAMGMMGGGFGGGGKGSGDLSDAAGASFIQSQYTMFQQILKASLRKVSLTLTWQVMGSGRDMKVVAYFTDAAGMDKVINGMGSQDLDDAQGSGGGTGGGGGGGGGGRGSGGGGAGGGGSGRGSGK